MREILEFPLLTARRYRAIVSLALLVVLSSGCSIKHTIKTPVIQYRTASFDEVLDLLRSYDKINILTGNILRLTLTTGRRENGQLEQYRNAPGYILLKRPESIHLVVQIPITKTTAVDLLSVGDELSAWIPRDNKLYVGKNSAKELIVEDPRQSKEFRIPIRGAHIFEAIFPQNIQINEPGIRLALTDESDARTKYYLLEVLREGVAPRICVVRKIWIERVGLTIARQQVFTDEGQAVSDIVYSNETRVGEFSLPQRIRINRPLDAYSLDVEFKNWRINPDLPDDAFIMPPHPGAEIIHLKERERSNAS
jgi:hypothetical protein